MPILTFISITIFIVICTIELFFFLQIMEYLGNSSNINRLTNSLNVSNYYNFDNKDLTNILITNNSDAWNILRNYLDLNRLTN